jgi:hypothetical protein
MERGIVGLARRTMGATNWCGGSVTSILFFDNRMENLCKSFGFLDSKLGGSSANLILFVSLGIDTLVVKFHLKGQKSERL